MQVIELGDTRVVQVRPEDSIDHAIELMEQNGFRHLPVVERGHIRGMVSDRDILKAVGMLPSVERTASTVGPAQIGAKRVSEVMTTPAITAPAESPLHVAAELMLRENIRAVPLVYKDHLSGIVTQTDYLTCYLDSRPMGRKPGWRHERVEQHMTSPVVSMREHDTFLHALRTMQTHRIRHLPVVEGDRLIGIVSDRDMRRVLGAWPVEAEARVSDGVRGGHEQVVMRDIMQRDVITTGPSATLAEAADVLVRNKISCLPVSEDGLPSGIITDTDLLEAFVAAFR